MKTHSLWNQPTNKQQQQNNHICIEQKQRQTLYVLDLLKSKTVLTVISLAEQREKNRSTIGNGFSQGR